MFAADFGRRVVGLKRRGHAVERRDSASYSGPDVSYFGNPALRGWNLSLWVEAGFGGSGGW